MITFDQYLEKRGFKVDPQSWRNAARKLRDNPVFQKAVAGGLSGMGSAAIIMPVDTISDTQKQWRNTRNEPELNRISKSFLATAKELVHPKARENAQGGIRPFYAGGIGKLLKVAPAQAMGFAFEEGIRRRIFK